MDALCVVANRQGKQLNERALRAAAGVRDADTELAVLAPILHQANALQEGYLQKFKRLSPPKGDEAQFAQMLRFFRDQNDLTRRLAEAADRRDTANFRLLNDDLKQLTREAAEFTRSYGLHECGSGKNRPDAASSG